MADQPLQASCHCGAVTITVPHVPTEINECQCTICRRYAAAWAYYNLDQVKIDLKEGAKLSKYFWGARDSSFEFCAECGCVCYWWPVEEKGPDGSAAKCGINTRNMDPMALFYVDRKIERSWVKAPVKDPSKAHRDDLAQY